MAFTTHEKRPQSLKNAAVSTFLLANAFVWYLSTYKFLQVTADQNFGNESLFIISFNFAAFVITAFIGTALIERFKKRSAFIKYWLLTGLAISVLFAVINLNNYLSLSLLSGTIGAFFGLGVPTFAGFFAANTEPKNRAKFGGLIVLLIVLLFPTITLIGFSSIFMTAGILILWLSIGLTCLLYCKPAEKLVEKKAQISYQGVFLNKTFLLYIVPWLMFSLINDLTSQIITNEFSRFPPVFSENYMIFGNILAGVCAALWGFLADKKGRKRLALAGFALLGIGYAALGLFSGDYIAALFYVCADGIAWGAFTMLFITTLWGDIAQDHNSEKYYILGVLPYLFSNFAGASMGTYLAQSVVSANTVFSFAAFFLFAATLPLFYAPETLPEKLMKDRDLKSYIENAQKKAVKLSQKKRQPPKEEEKPKPTKNDASYEEAKKLAEKYY